MVDHFSDLTYVNLMRRTSQKENFEVKSDLERWAVTFGFKIKRYHAYSGIFSEQILRPEIEDSNQTITFCGVVSHHQNAIIDGNIKNIKLGYITLLLHAKFIGQRQ